MRPYLREYGKLLDYQYRVAAIAGRRNKARAHASATGGALIPPSSCTDWTTLNSRHSFLAGGGEMGALMREHDWRRHPLGTPDTWPSTLKTLVRLLLSSNHPMFIWWGEDLVQFYNDAYRQTLGPERHPQALGAPGRQCWAEAWHLIGPDVERVMAGGSTWHEDRLVPLTRNGVRDNIWWTYGYSPIEDEAGIRGVLVICKEVTEEHLLRERLEQTNHALIETMDEGFCLIDMVRDETGRAVDYEFVEVNKAFSQQTGLRNCVGRRARELVPGLEQRWIDIYDEIAVTGAARRFVEGSSAMGRWFSVYASRIRHPGGRRVALLFTDITERKQTEEALRESEAKFRTIADAMPQMIWSATPDGRFDYANEGWREFAGVAPESLHGAGWKVLADPAELPALHAAWCASQDGGAPFEIEHHARHRSGEWRWVLTRALPVRDAEGRILRWMGTMTDIHEQKTISEELRLANSRKDEFLAMLAHELRNPLAPISTAAQILKLSGSDPKRLAHASDVIGRQVRHMVELVDDLLDVSRVNRGLAELERVEVDMRTVLHGALEQARPLIERQRHTLVEEVGPGSAIVIGDSKRLVQVLANLLTNAAKYTPEGGRIAVALSTTLDEVRLSVRDNGIGIEAPLLPHVFDLFTQAKRTPDRSHGGLGLGLALVRSMIVLHGGRVEADSAGLGQGSCFTVILPRHAPAAAGDKGSAGAPLPAQAAGQPAPLLVPRRVLIVDDNRDAAESLCVVLNAAGHRVAVETTPEAALARAAGEAIDVYLLDIGLPGMDGHRLVEHLRAMPNAAAARMIALSGYGQAQDIAASKRAGFDAHLVKPVELPQLLALLAA